MKMKRKKRTKAKTIFLTVLFLCAVLTGCEVIFWENPYVPTEPPEEPIGGGLKTAALIGDMTCGSGSEEKMRQNTYYSYSEITPENLAEGLSAWTGLEFAVTVTHGENGGMSVDWAADSTLVAGLDGREQKDEFYMSDADTMRWFMMDSLWRTLAENYSVTEIYYTMEGGAELRLEGLSPVSAFTLDTPYMGSGFYYAHADLRGHDSNDEINDNMEDDGAQWWGTFLNLQETKSLYMVNFNGNSFLFGFETMDGLTFDGTAAVEGRLAYYMDLMFVIDMDGEEISVSFSEQRDDSHEREPFTGIYFRNYH